MNQCLLQFQLPDKVRVYPNQFRELVAALDLQKPEFFHRHADGSMNPDLPALCFVGGHAWVGILAAPGQERLLQEIAGPATLCLSRYLQTSVPVQFKEIQFGVRPSFVPVSYRLREIALKRRYQATRDKPVDELIKERLIRGLLRIANQYGLDMPTDDAMDIQVTIRKERGLRLVVPNQVTNEYVHLVDADISMSVHLEGMWLVGNLTSRGYGRLIKEHPGIASHRAIEGVTHD